MGLGEGRYQPGSAVNDESAKAILTQTTNFGVNGTVKVDGITIVNGGTTNGAALVTMITNENPDIIVIGYNYTGQLNTETRTALNNFVQNNGVLIAFTEGNAGNVVALINTICASSVTINSNGPGGTNYQFRNIDIPVLNGPFGDIRGKWWGEDYGTTFYLSVVPANATVLTYHSNATYSANPTAIIHNTLGFIWAGDGGVIAGNSTNTDNYLWPCKNTNGIPVKKTQYTNGGADGAYNSFFYANAIAWAIDYVTTNKP
jgi:hypothetical protein